MAKSPPPEIAYAAALIGPSGELLHLVGLDSYTDARAFSVERLAEHFDCHCVITPFAHVLGDVKIRHLSEVRFPDGSGRMLDAAMPLPKVFR